MVRQLRHRQHGQKGTSRSTEPAERQMPLYRFYLLREDNHILAGARLPIAHLLRRNKRLLQRAAQRRVGAPSRCAPGQQRAA
jgi:hypothetical protein